MNLMLQLSQTKKCGFSARNRSRDESRQHRDLGRAHDQIDFQITLRLGAAPMQIASSASWTCAANRRLLPNRRERANAEFVASANHP